MHDRIILFPKVSFLFPGMTIICMLGIFSKILSGKLSECQTVSIHIRPSIFTWLELFAKKSTEEISYKQHFCK